MDEIETQTVQQISTPANSSAESSSETSPPVVENPRKNPPRMARQTRYMTRYGTSDETIDTTDTTAEDTDDVVIDRIEAGSSRLLEGKKTGGLGKGIKRKKNVSYLPRANNVTAYEASWTEIDKRRLLIALQRYGILEIDKLINSVPQKSEADIRKFIAIRWKMARTELREQLKGTRKPKGDKSYYLGPVDKWLEVLGNFYPNYDHYKTNPIAHAVLLIWKYEKHPDPSECGGVDFKALYEYMYCMLCGYPPKHLNQPTAIFLAETLKNFAGHIRNGNWSEIMEHMCSPLKINPSKRSPVSEEDVIAALSFSKEKCIEELAKLPGFNPFCIPPNLLKKKDDPETTNLD